MGSSPAGFLADPQGPQFCIPVPGLSGGEGRAQCGRPYGRGLPEERERQWSHDKLPAGQPAWTRLAALAESLAFLAVLRSAGSTVVVVLQLGHRNGVETRGTSVRVPWEGQKRPVTNELRVLAAEIPQCARPWAGTRAHKLPQPLPLLHGLPHPETQPQGRKAPSLGLLTASCLVFKRNYWSFS